DHWASADQIATGRGDGARLAARPLLAELVLERLTSDLRAARLADQLVRRLGSAHPARGPRFGNLLPPGAGVGSGPRGTTWSTSRRAPKWRANAAALSPAARDASEKSVANRTLHMRRGSVMAVVSSWLHGIATIEKAFDDLDESEIRHDHRRQHAEERR